jgi:DNA primase
VSDEIGEIRSRINIVDLVEAYGVSLKRSGKTYTGLCPFHADKRPSFNVNPSFGSYICWSCQEKGDIFTWVMKTQNVEFGEALKILAERAGVTLTRSKPDVAPSVRKARESTMEFAAQFFRAELAKSAAAKAYCERRGLSQETIDNWELGYAPDAGEALVLALKKAGYTLSEAQELFLVEGDQSTGYRDKFRGRLIFPIRAERGDLVAFGGRLLGDGHPKYINSGDTPLYRKSKVLYGMFRAAKPLMKEKRAVLVEGYLDVIACHQAGLEVALASLGTALAEDQARLLKRWVEDVTILYDGDAAGRKAADRASDVLAEAGLRVKVAPLPEGDDPDTLLRRGGPAELMAAAKAGLAPLDFRLKELERNHSVTEEAFWTQAVNLLADAPTELEITRHVDRLAPQYPDIRDVIQAQKALRSEVTLLRRERMRQKRSEGRGASEPVQAKPIRKLPEAPLSPAELTLIYAYVEDFGRAELQSVFAEPGLMNTPTAARIAKAIVEAFSESRGGAPSGPPTGWMDRLPPEVVEALEGLNFSRVGQLTDVFVRDSIEHLRRSREKAENQRLSAVETGDDRLRGIQERLRKLKS